MARSSTACHDGGLESPLPASMPRTSEVLWNGLSSLPFVLKRKRNGAILVTKIKATPSSPSRSSPTLDLRLGSELKLVGGFPVAQLTLTEVKKVMVHAPKPVSLVFLNHDDVFLDNMSFLSEDRGSFENEFDYDTATSERDHLYPPTLRESSEWAEPPRAAATADSDAALHFYTTGGGGSSRRRAARDDSSSVFDTAGSGRSMDWTGSMTSTSSSFLYEPASPRFATTGSIHSHSRRRRRSPDSEPPTASPPRKVSKLKLALERMNQLLNRPVRRSGLNVAAGKSIVV